MVGCPYSNLFTSISGISINKGLREKLPTSTFLQAPTAGEPIFRGKWNICQIIWHTPTQNVPNYLSNLNGLLKRKTNAPPPAPAWTHSAIQWLTVAVTMGLHCLPGFGSKQCSLSMALATLPTQSLSFEKRQCIGYKLGWRGAGAKAWMSYL